MDDPKLIFKEIALEDAEKYFQQINLSKDQGRRVRLLAKLGIHYLPLSEDAMMGFAHKAIKQYQMEKKIQLIAFESMNKEERIEMVANILEIIKKLLLDVMMKPEQSDLLDETVKKVLTFYIEKIV